MPDIHLSEPEMRLLSMYALPHAIRNAPKGDNGPRFKKLKDMGLVREGIGRAIVPTKEIELKGDESIEEFQQAVSSSFADTPGWVVTERGMQVMLAFVAVENRPKALAVMRMFVADKDPT